jgi:thiol-disulfide isomerase/thioredoxin
VGEGLGRFSTMKEKARTAALLVLGGAAITAVALVATGPSADLVSDIPPMIEPAHSPARAWANATWLNVDTPVTLASLRGRVVLLDFWTYTCPACTNALPSLIEMDRRYRAQGLSVIGVHTPEFPPYAGEHDRANVAAALDQYGITYPVTQDNDATTFHLYDARYWPTYVLIDKAGTIRFHGAGSLALGGARQQWWETQIRELLEE